MEPIQTWDKFSSVYILHRDYFLTLSQGMGQHHFHLNLLVQESDVRVSSSESKRKSKTNPKKYIQYSLLFFPWLDGYLKQVKMPISLTPLWVNPKCSPTYSLHTNLFLICYFSSYKLWNAYSSRSPSSVGVNNRANPNIDVSILTLFLWTL